MLNSVSLFVYVWLTLHTTKADDFRLYDTLGKSKSREIAKVLEKLLTNEKYYGIM